MDLVQREKLFLILSSKLDKEDAEELTKQIADYHLSLINNKLKSDIKLFNDQIDIIEGKFVDSKGNITKSLNNVAYEATQQTYKSIINMFKYRLECNKDLLIEILR